VFLVDPAHLVSVVHLESVLMVSGSACGAPCGGAGDSERPEADAYNALAFFNCQTYYVGCSYCKAYHVLKAPLLKSSIWTECCSWLG
jgi:hypothetical protein